MTMMSERKRNLPDGQLHFCRLFNGKSVNLVLKGVMTATFNADGLASVELSMDLSPSMIIDRYDHATDTYHPYVRYVGSDHHVPLGILDTCGVKAVGDTLSISVELTGWKLSHRFHDEHWCRLYLSRDTTEGRDCHHYVSDAWMDSIDAHDLLMEQAKAHVDTM